MSLFSAVVWLMGAVLLPETYAPVLLRKRAAELTKLTGRKYISVLEKRGAKKPTLPQALKTALGRPWIFLIREPIVTLITIYMAIVYGTLYMCFGAFPIVYQQGRGWSPGIGGLAFIAVAVGFMLALMYIIPDNKRYERAEDEAKARGEPNAPPEARLPPALVGSILLPVGLFWFAWTNGPEIHWIVSMLACIPFGAGMVMLFLSCLNYLIDSYTVYAASVLAANSILRSLFGAAFPLFTNYMYQSLGIHWASSVPAFLAVACIPFPFLFYRYGAAVRKRCKYSKQAMDIMASIRASEHVDSDGKEVPKERDDSDSQDIETGLPRRTPFEEAKEKDTELQRNGVDATDKEVEGLDGKSHQAQPVALIPTTSQQGAKPTLNQPQSARRDLDAVSIDSRASRPECHAPAATSSVNVDAADLERVRTLKSVPL